MNKIFKEGDNEYSFDKIDDESIKRVENKLGYKFPKSFIELLKIRNGGEIKDYECWMTGIYGISKEENNLSTFSNCSVKIFKNSWASRLSVISTEASSVFDNPLSPSVSACSPQASAHNSPDRSPGPPSSANAARASLYGPCDVSIPS